MEPNVSTLVKNNHSQNAVGAEVVLVISNTETLQCVAQLSYPLPMPREHPEKRWSVLRAIGHKDNLQVHQDEDFPRILITTMLPHIPQLECYLHRKG